MSHVRDGLERLTMGRVNAVLAILVAVIAWPSASTRVSAECVSDGGSPSKRLKSYPLVFVGDVRGFEGSFQPNWLGYRVKFQVIEAFRGIEVGERIVSFVSTAESFAFAPSQRVLVYASRSQDDYSTQCTATRVVSSDDREVLELRRLSRRPPPANRVR